MGKWIVLAAWVVIFVAAANPAASSRTPRRTSRRASCPATPSRRRSSSSSTSSTKEGEQADAVIVYARDGGLTAADQAAIAEDRASLNRDRPEAAGPTGPPVLARDGDAALLVTPLFIEEGDSDTLLDAVEDIRDRVGDAPEGLQVKVRRRRRLLADAIEVFDDINSTLLLATALIVFVLLVIIYRSPIFWILPLLAVAFAEVTVRAIGYGLPRPGGSTARTAASCWCWSSAPAPTTRCC